MEDHQPDAAPAAANQEADLVQSALWQPDAAKALLNALCDNTNSSFNRHTLIDEVLSLTDQQLLSLMRICSQHCRNTPHQGHSPEDHLVITLTTSPHDFSSRFPMLPLFVAGALSAIILGIAASEGAYGAWAQQHLYSKDQVNEQVQYRAVLMESTSKDPWNVSNTKLQLLADHTYNWYVYYLSIVSFFILLQTGRTTR